MTIAELVNILAEHGYKYGSQMEVRMDSDPDVTDQTPQEVVAVERLIDEDDNEFLCLHVRNT